MTTAPLLELRPYQRQARTALVNALREGGRAQLHAACGSGKTLIAAIAAVDLVQGPGVTVVLAPSLSLVSQILATFRALTAPDAVLAVCSDDTVVDDPVRAADFDAEVSTDPAAIEAWLTSHTGRLLVVGTYLSAHRLAAAARATGVRVELLVCDEAHHLAGRADFATRRVLDDQFLPAARRLHMTATPRIDDVRVDTVGALSMDDEALFGPVAYRYRWSQAIEEGWLDDYRVSVIGVSEQQLWQMLRDEDRAYTDDLAGPDLRMLATQAVIAKAAKQYGLRRIIAFCHRIETAAEFARTLPATVRRLANDDRPEGSVHAGLITGEMNARMRERALHDLRHPPAGWSVLANVRCLSEGVDVPAVDAVAFTHPKSSQVDIIQSVGRALRRAPEGAGIAQVIVPIVIPSADEEYVGDLDPGEFAVLWQVVRALRAHDDILGVELDTQRSHATTHNPQLPGKISIELPTGTSDALLADLTALLVTQTTSSWWVGYGHARDYTQHHGNLLIASAHVTSDGFALGNWILNARQHFRKGWLTDDRVSALDELGMIWDTRQLAWQRLFDELTTYRTIHGHTEVPQNHRTSTGYPLGNRINAARRGKDAIPAHVRASLDELGMIWDTRDLRWQRLFDACYRYHTVHGDLDVAKSYSDDTGYPLGVRLAIIRGKWRKGRLDPAEQAALEELGMRFDRPDESTAFTQLLDACDRYVSVHGSLAGVEKSYVDPTGYRLGATISYYRNLHAGSKGSPVPAARRAALDARGMIWRIAPARDATGDEISTLHTLSGPDRALEILRLIDESGVTQSSIAAGLGIHRSALNVKVRTFRDTGHWPERRSRRRRTPPEFEGDDRQ